MEEERIQRIIRRITQESRTLGRGSDVAGNHTAKVFEEGPLVFCQGVKVRDIVILVLLVTEADA